MTSTRLSFFYETSPKHITLFFQKINQGLYPVKDVEIVDFSCGNNHTVRLDEQIRCLVVNLEFNVALISLIKYISYVKIYIMVDIPGYSSDIYKLFQQRKIIFNM